MMAAQSSGASTSLDSTTHTNSLKPLPPLPPPAQLDSILSTPVTSAATDSNQWEHNLSSLIPGFGDASFLSQINAAPPGGAFGDSTGAFLPQLMSPSLLPSVTSVGGAAPQQQLNSSHLLMPPLNNMTSAGGSQQLSAAGGTGT